LVGRNLDGEVAHPVRQAARKTFLDRPDDFGRAVGDDEQRIPEPSGAQVLEERPRRLHVLLRARHQRQEHLASVLANPPRGQYRLAPLARPKPLGDAVDEQVDDGVLRKIAFAEILVFGPQPFGDLAHRRSRQKPSARLVGERILDIARRQTARVDLHRQPLEFPRASRQRRAHARDERLGRVANLRRGVFDCASAVFTLPVRYPLR
jgi:hypothetical protein